MGTAPRDRSQSLDKGTFTATFHDVLRAYNNDAILKQAAVVLLTGHPFDPFATSYERGQLSELRPIAPIVYEFVQRAAGDIASYKRSVSRHHVEINAQRVRPRRCVRRGQQGHKRGLPTSSQLCTQEGQGETAKVVRKLTQTKPKNEPAYPAKVNGRQRTHAPGLVVRGAVPEEASPKVMVAPVNHSHDDT